MDLLTIVETLVVGLALSCVFAFVGAIIVLGMIKCLVVITDWLGWW